MKNKNNNNKYRPVNRWSAEDKQAFADRNFLKSQTVTMRRFEGATEDEWRPFAERTRQIFRYLAEHQDESALAEYEQRVEKEFQKSVRTHLSQ